MKKLFVSVLVVLSLSGCTRAGEAERVLASQGFTDIQAGGYAFFGCDEKDVFQTKFTATSPTGQRVKGQVCSGWFKGATVRFD